MTRDTSRLAGDREARDATRGLSISLVPTPLTKPLLSGEVSLPGIRLVANIGRSVDRNSKAMLGMEFDIGEMSLATFLKAYDEGVPLVGIPVFTGRRFVHAGIHCRPGAGIETPADLRGRRVGLPQFWMTSSVWHRILLAEAYGIAQEEVRWVTTAAERLSSAAYPPGADVALRSGEHLGVMMDAGEIDAALLPKMGGRLIGDAAWEHPFPDLVPAQRAEFVRTGILPIMHFVVLRRALVDAIPELPLALTEAFQKIKRSALTTPANFAEMESPIEGISCDKALDIFDGDPWPYGIEPNLNVLRFFIEHAHRQGLVRSRYEPEMLFAIGSPARL